MLGVLKVWNRHRADPDQTASEEAVLSGYSLFAILSSDKNFVDSILEKWVSCAVSLLSYHHKSN